MERYDIFLSILDDLLSTKRNRQIVGGVLVSTSLLFGGLALTILTLKMEDNDEQQDC